MDQYNKVVGSGPNPFFTDGCSLARDQLRELFREKKKRARPANIDWAGKRDAWIAAVRALYGTIVEDYLKAARDDVEIAQTDKVVAESNLGEYHIPELVLRVGEEEVVFSPKGANVAGAQGRIDIRGERGDAAIVWQGDERWSIVAARVPALRLLPLTADSLAEVLREIMRL